jgi:PAS domain S-box-containing protein
VTGPMTAPYNAAADRTAMIEIVRRAPVPTFLIDLPGGRIAAASRAAGTLLGTSDDDVLVGQRVADLSSEALSIRRALSLVLDGDIDGYWRGNRVLQRLDGTSVVAEVTVSANRFHSQPRFAVVVGRPPNRDPGAGTLPAAMADPDLRVFGVVGPAWQLSHVSCTVTDLLGFEAGEVLGRPILEFIHPGDVPELLMTLGTAAGRPRMARTHIRLLGATGDWHLCRTHITPLAGADLPSFAFVAHAASVPAGERALAHDAAELLMRIAHEVRGVEPEPASTAASQRSEQETALAVLSQREREIVKLLLAGERVPGIAANLVLSQSTIRNHLAGAFRKLGVHSQQELLRRFWT